LWNCPVSKYARMYMASRKRNPFFRRPHVLTRWSLAELENPHWPAPLYSVRASMEKAVCLTECLWCFLAAPPNPPPTPLPFRHTPVHPQLPSTLQHPDSPNHLSISVSLWTRPLSSDGHTLVTSARRPSNNPHRPLASSNSHLRRHNQQVIEDMEELRNGRECIRLSVSFFRVPSFFFTSFDRWCMRKYQAFNISFSWSKNWFCYKINNNNMCNFSKKKIEKINI